MLNGFNMLKKYSTIWFAVLSVITILVSCTKTTEITEPEVSYFVVKVDSISVPDTIAHSDTLRIKFYGTIGCNSNYSFDHFEAQKTLSSVNLTVWGKYVANEGAFDVLATLQDNDVEYKVSSLNPGVYEIFIHQPDSSMLSDSVTVE